MTFDLRQSLYFKPVKKNVSVPLMSLLYIAAGINHFLNPRFYINIMPAYLPAHAMLVSLSGICEILLGTMLLFNATRKAAAWLIVCMLIVFFTVHIDMVIKNYPGQGKLFWISVLRLPLQFVLIRWACKVRHVRDIFKPRQRKA